LLEDGRKLSRYPTKSEGISCARNTIVDHH
jgi:hypothetical protein